MRDMVKENNWHAHPKLGYVSLDADGIPCQPVVIYKTIKTALRHSPTQHMTEVRMFQPIEVSQ